MINNRKIAVVAFGVNEFIFSILISLPVWVKALHNVVVPAVILFSILFFAVLTTIWQMFHRQNAKVFLFAFACRVFYLGSVFVICQIGGLFDSDRYKFLWLLITIILFLFGIFLHFKLEKKHWQKTLADWEEIDKMNVAKKYFRIYGAYHSHPPTPENFKKIYLIIPIGTIALTVIMGILGNDFKMAFLHLGMMGLGYFCVFMLGRILAWITEVRKLENELGVTFVTEYGMVKEKGKRYKH